MTKPRLLIIDDEPSFIDKMRIGFNGYQFVEALTAEQCCRILEHNSFDLILLDLKLDPAAQNLEGLQLIKPIKSKHPDSPLVVITADEKQETAVDAMKKGADDFLCKSNFNSIIWKKKFDDLIKINRLNQELRNLHNEKYPFVGNSPEINEIKNTLSLLAENTWITVLISGETGVGKEVAARHLHQLGKRRQKPFVAVNLSVIQESLLESALFGHEKGAFTGAISQKIGRFELADGGTIFLDEIGDLPLELQAKLLRVLQEGEFERIGNPKTIQGVG